MVKELVQENGVFSRHHILVLIATIFVATLNSEILDVRKK